MLAIGGDVAVPRPSWVSYAAQASLIGARPWFVDIRPGEGGVPDPARLGVAVRAARAEGRQIRSVILHPAGQPDRHPGQRRDDTRPLPGRRGARPDHHLRRDLPGPRARALGHVCGQWPVRRWAAAPFASPAAFAPGRTIVTTALSKSLALGGWRIGVARLPGDGADRSQASTAPAPARAPARHRQRDLVRAGGADPAGGRLRLQRPARAHRADRAQPPAAPGGRPGRRRPVPRPPGARRARAAGRLLPLPRLRPGAGPAARPGTA